MFPLESRAACSTETWEVRPTDTRITHHCLVYAPRAQLPRCPWRWPPHASAPAMLAHGMPCSSRPLPPAPAAASPSGGRARICAGDGARPCRPAANAPGRDRVNRTAGCWRADAESRGTSPGSLGHTTSMWPTARSGAALFSNPVGPWRPVEAVDGPLLPPKW